MAKDKATTIPASLVNQLQGLINYAPVQAAGPSAARNPLDYLKDETILNALLGLGTVDGPLGYLLSRETAEAQTKRKSAADLAKELGLDTSLESFQKYFTDAAQAGVSARDSTMRGAINAFYQSLAGQGANISQAMRQAQAQAQASGVTSGMAAANMLSALLGQTQNTSADALKVTQLGVDAANQNAADLANALRDAFTGRNDLALALQQASTERDQVSAQNLAAFLELGAAGMGSQSVINDRIANAIANMNQTDASNAATRAQIAADQNSHANTLAAQALAALSSLAGQDKLPENKATTRAYAPITPAANYPTTQAAPVVQGPTGYVPGGRYVPPGTPTNRRSW